MCQTALQANQCMAAYIMCRNGEPVTQGTSNMSKCLIKQIRTQIPVAPVTNNKNYKAFF